MAPKDSEIGCTKPPSSYPGIFHTPTAKGDTFLSVDGWIDGKRKDDNIGNLWRVHDKLYDFTPFIALHPGGPHWLQITQGTDITEAFETAHVVRISLVASTLQKYFIQDAKHPRFSPFTFKETGFFMTLKKRIQPIMQEVGTGPTKQLVLMQDAMVIAFISLGLLGTIYDSIILKILSGTLLTWCLVGAHNFFHLRNNWRKYYYDLGLLSSYEWLISHALSHHLYPNTVMDMEMDMFPTYKFWPNEDKSFIQKYGPPIYSHLLYLVGFWIDFGKRIFNIIRGRQQWRVENWIVLIELGVLMIIAPSIKEGIYSWIVIHTACSFTFLTQGANAAHHHPDIFHDGDEARPDPDFGLCQLDATRTRAGELQRNTWVILVSFGEHILHHLFPTICHSKLHYIKLVFEETLKEFSEEAPKLPLWEFYLGCFRQLARTKPSTLRKKAN